MWPLDVSLQGHRVDHGKVENEWGEGVSVKYKKTSLGTSLGDQWLRIHASNAGGLGSIPGQVTKILHATRGGKKKKRKKKERKTSP